MTRQRRQPKEKEELTKDQFIERLSALIHAAAEATAAAYSVVVEITEFDRSVNVTDIEPRERPTVLWETISRAQQKAGVIVAMLYTPGGNTAEIERVINLPGQTERTYVVNLNGETMSFTESEVKVYAEERR
jgi:hypothetical protein